jgi:general L-amino acid transport system permease protein
MAASPATPADAALLAARPAPAGAWAASGDPAGRGGWAGQGGQRGLRLRALLYQWLAIAAAAALVGLLATQTLANMRARGIQSGFDFLLQPAGFDIGERWLAFDATRPYWQAFAVGIVNTLRVALPGCVLATLLGGLLGIGRFSRNALVRGLCYGYVELFRNIPLLLQLLMWYLLCIEYLPPSTEPLRAFEAVFLSKNGLSFPLLVADRAAWLGGAGLALGGMAMLAVARAGHRRFAHTGQRWRLAAWAWLLVPACGVAGWLAGGAALHFERPVAGELQVEGGGALSPEYLAVMLALVLYTAAFIAEVVRAGIASVPRGQLEAAASVGLPRALALRLVVLPQALRLVVPPLTNQFLNLTKNSSLAVAVGYPELVSVANTSLNQSGRAVECIAIVMAVYLSLSLLTAALMAAFNRRVAVRER